MQLSAGQVETANRSLDLLTGSRWPCKRRDPRLCRTCASRCIGSCWPTFALGLLEASISSSRSTPRFKTRSEGHQSRVIAANNILNGSWSPRPVSKRFWPPCSNVVVAIYIYRLVPEFLIPVDLAADSLYRQRGMGGEGAALIGQTRLCRCAGHQVPPSGPFVIVALKPWLFA